MTRPLLCQNCRRQGRCSSQWRVARDTFFSMADDREVDCSDFLPTWQARLAA